MPYGNYASLFDINGTCSTTYVDYDWGFGGTVTAAVSDDANHTVYTVSKVTLSNDDAAITMEYVLDFPRSATETIVEAANKDHTLLAGETVTHHVRCNTLWIKSASGTPTFRAWGEG